MAELDQWTDANVIAPLCTGDEDETFEMAERAIELVKRAIRAKVLESYRNGQAAGPSRQPRTGYQPRRQFSRNN